MKKIVILFVLLIMNMIVYAKPPQNTFVELNTTKGKIVLELFHDVPQHSKNFIKLVKEKFYDSLLFHRVIPQFMIQGGDPKSKDALDGQILGSGDNGYRVPAEFMIPTYFHRKGALAAARDNNPDKASSGCQFYIVVGRTFTDEQLNTMETNTGVKYTDEMREVYKTIGGTPHLDGSYTVYGQTVEGQDVVDAISNAERDATDRPKEDIRIISAVILKKWKPKK